MNIFRFAVGQTVSVFDRGVYRLGTVTAIEPYRGRPGYYVSWSTTLDGKPLEQWHSHGGWKPETHMATPEQHAAWGEP